MAPRPTNSPRRESSRPTFPLGPPSGLQLFPRKRVRRACLGSRDRITNTFGEQYGQSSEVCQIVKNRPMRMRCFVNQHAAFEAIYLFINRTRHVPSSHLGPSKV